MQKLNIREAVSIPDSQLLGSMKSSGKKIIMYYFIEKKIKKINSHRFECLIVFGMINFTVNFLSG